VADGLTLEGLSRYTGEPEERLREWRSLGLIGRADSEMFLPEDAERARLVQLCLRRGISAEAVARADKEQGLLAHYLDLFYPKGVGLRYSLAEAAEIIDLDYQLLRRLGSALGFVAEWTLREEDVEALRALRTITAILPEEAIRQGLRVYSDALGRVAEMETRLFHFFVHERLRAQGMSGAQLAQATQAASDQMRETIEPAILYFHRLGWERAVEEDLVTHMAKEAGLIASGEVPGELTRAIMFVDLASFTPMTAAMGDAAAADILERFSDLVRQAVFRWDARLVKQIGDAFMLVFGDARSAVACALEIESRAAKETQFPAVRAGIHWGTLLYREGDYVGSNVNIASRLATEAARHQVLVTADVRKEARDLPEIEFARLGKRQLKGVSVKLDLFEVRSSAAPGAGAEKVIDPVCGMELGPGEIAARLSLEGTERAFCSEECLRKFVSSPQAYAGAERG
jgi:class 3 adenylate cyclase